MEHGVVFIFLVCFVMSQARRSCIIIPCCECCWTQVASSVAGHTEVVQWSSAELHSIHTEPFRTTEVCSNCRVAAATSQCRLLLLLSTIHLSCLPMSVCSLILARCEFFVLFNWTGHHKISNLSLTACWKGVDEHVIADVACKNLWCHIPLKTSKLLPLQLHPSCLTTVCHLVLVVLVWCFDPHYFWCTFLSKHLLFSVG